MILIPSRYRIDLAFHGRQFHGWQRQPDLRTVQAELEQWLQRLLNAEQPIAVTGAGRTDAGVHAENMVAHFDTLEDFVAHDLVHRLNRAMPDDIVVQSISSVNPEFHARFNATQKTYRYRVRTTRSPFERDRVWQINQELNVTTMNCAAGAIVGSFDFAGFCRADSLKPNTTCSIRQSEWTVHDDGLSYYVTADRFLHQMVRLMVGTMVEIGRGQLAPDRMHEIISARDVRLCGQAAPPHGLSLIQVDYPS